MSQTKITQKQMTLAETAQANPGYRFTNLYSLMHWDIWIQCAANAVLQREGSSTAGIDGTTRDNFKAHYYGFRKGRRTMDAIAVIMPLFNESVKHFYVIEGDIQSYFDTVHHRKLMSILRQRIADKDLLDLIWKFLK